MNVEIGENLSRTLCLIAFFVAVILLISAMGCADANAQERTTPEILKLYEIEPFKRDSVVILHKYSGATDYMPIIECIGDDTLIIYQDLMVIISLSLRKAYEKECSEDTIKATMLLGQYLIDRGTYKEMLTEKQLEERGYKYKYRWIISFEPYEAKYYFLKEPTFAGFTEYLRKLKNGKNE